jgi:heme exporter protein C
MKELPEAAMERSSSRSTLILQILIALTAVLALITLYEIFVVAPVEKQMGIVQKIFYFHVPSAYAMYIGFGVSAVASAVYLAKRDDRWDALAVAGAEVGSLFCLIVLVTGPFWARKAWGTFWTWDPRLTTTLLAGMIYFAYVVLRSFGGAGEVEKRFAAGLAIFGLLDMPIIHYSVQRWRGTHPTVITGKGGGLHPDMYPALFLSFGLFTLLATILIWQRARAELQAQKLAAIESDAAEHGLLEET